jgi:Co/Zn/Cd efflux system component
MQSPIFQQLPGTVAWFWDIPFIDAIAVILSSLLIIRWSGGLLKDSGKTLLSSGKITKPNS